MWERGKDEREEENDCGKWGWEKIDRKSVNKI